MKNLLCFLILTGTVLFSSCSSDNKSPNNPVTPVQSTLTAKVNGQDVVFDSPTVEKQNLTTEQGVPYTDLIVTANKKNDATAKIVFKLEHLTTGTGSCYYFLYQKDGSDYETGHGNVFNIDITSNTQKNIKGNFSGVLADYQGNTVTTANGIFDINF